MKANDQILTLEQILRKQMPVGKVSTIAIILDVSSLIKDEHRKVYTSRMKVVDHTFNFNSFNPYIHSKYLTVYFQSKQPLHFPYPRHIGDFLYIKRFKFKLYNNQPQAFPYNQQFCAWYLISGDIEQDGLTIYSSSRQSTELKEEQCQAVRERVKSLKHFSRQYLANQSIMAVVPVGIKNKDRDYVVQVLSWSPEGFTLLLNGEQIFLPYIQSYVTLPCLAKLNSVVRIQLINGRKQAVCTQYTSLTKIYNWSYDAKMYESSREKRKEVDSQIYTRLAPLMTAKLPKKNHNLYEVQVTIADIVPATFIEAIEYFDRLNHYSYKYQPGQQDSKQQAELVYNIKLVCLDRDYEESRMKAMKDQIEQGEFKIYQIYVYSEGGKGGNFIDKIKLEDIGPFTSFQQQQMLFQQRREALLNAAQVRMKVQLIQDQQGSRMFRLIDILQLIDI